MLANALGHGHPAGVQYMVSCAQTPFLPPLSSRTEPGHPIHSTQTPARLFIVHPGAARAGEGGPHPTPTWLYFPWSDLVFLSPVNV